MFLPCFACKRFCRIRRDPVEEVNFLVFKEEDGEQDDEEDE